MATTFATVRDNQLALLEAATPSKHADKKFRRHREQAEFMAWVEANPAACFRRMQLLSQMDVEQSDTSDGELVSWRHNIELRVAYPLQFGLYGAENERDLEDVLEQDAVTIDSTIGRHGYPNFVQYQELCERQSSTVIDVPGARVLSMTFLVQYDRSV